MREPMGEETVGGGDRGVTLILSVGEGGGAKGNVSASDRGCDLFFSRSLPISQPPSR